MIRWWRAMTPSNSLAAVYGIAADCAARRVLGPDVAIDIEVIDETNTRVDVPALLSRFRCQDNFGCVALVGVQSNQYPRAIDIARPFRAAGIAVAIGRFHVSGCLSMLDGRAVDLDACLRSRGYLPQQTAADPTSASNIGDLRARACHLTNDLGLLLDTPTPLRLRIRQNLSCHQKTSLSTRLRTSYPLQSDPTTRGPSHRLLCTERRSRPIA